MKAAAALSPGSGLLTGQRELTFIFSQIASFPALWSSIGRRAAI